MILYRCFDNDGVLLYVGVTGDIETRMAQHRSQSGWYSAVASTTHETVPLAAALTLERSAIISERPLHNVQHRRIGATASATYDPTDDSVIGVAGAALLLGVHISTVKRWAATARLPHVAKLDGRTGGYVFARSDIADQLRADIAERQARLDMLDRVAS